MIGWTTIANKIWPPPKPRPVAEQAKQDAEQDRRDGEGADDAAVADDADGGVTNGDTRSDEKTESAASDAAGKALTGDSDVQPAASTPTFALKHLTLGSLDPLSKQRMLVTLTTQGAAVEMIEVTDRKYLDVVDRSGYLGYLALRDRKDGVGCVVGVVGPGTPAANAGLMAGDVIVGINEQSVSNTASFYDALRKTKPGQAAKLSVQGKVGPATNLTVNLVRRPVSIVRPEYETKPLDTTGDTEADFNRDPLSFLLTIDSIGDQDFARLLNAKVDLRNVNWEVTKQEDGLIELSYPVPGRNLVAKKRYFLEPGQSTVDNDPLARAYHLTLEIEIENTSSEPQQVAYRLDGPTGLPTAGWWYLNKVQRSWGGAGLRDVARKLEQGEISLAGSGSIAGNEDPEELIQRNQPLDYMGVDALYFAAILIPEKSPEETWIAESTSVAIGSLPDKTKLPNKLTNVTCRLISKQETVEPGRSLIHPYTVFAGPKQRDLLTQYGPADGKSDHDLGELIYFGWPIFSLVAKPLGWILAMGFKLVGNYGLAIIMLTIVVRLCMFPISRKQAQGAMKMQELAPEMKRITDKHKKDMQKRSQAMQELYKKHNYSPLSGCLPLFIQMPIFIGLYKSLQANIELRGAPMIGEAVRWADNLSAPDMLLRWDSWMVFADKTGWLGPYFNILPICTVALFLWQQKLFTPPPTDEKAEMTQKMMKYMMFFMGLMFFKVPSGLCIYFIASSLWGIGERKLLPRPTPVDPSIAAKAAATKASEAKQIAHKAGTSPSSTSKTNGQGGGKKKQQQRSKKKGKR